MNIMTYVYIAFGAFALIGFVTGLIKGLYRSILDVIFVAINAIASGVTASIVAKNVVSPEEISKVLTEIVNSAQLDPATLETVTQMQTFLTNPDSNTMAISLVMALAAVVILPIIFMLCFIVYGIVLVIPKLIIQFVCIHKPRSWSLKFGGAAVCIISNIIAFAIFLVPVIGYVNYANTALEELSAIETQATTEAGEQTKLKVTADNVLAVTKPVQENFVSKTISALGGKALFNSLTTVNVQDTKVSLQAETSCVIKIYGESKHFNGPITEYGQEQIEAIESLENVISEAEFIPSLVANCLSYVATEWDQGRDVFGMQKPNLGKELQPSADEFIHILAQTNKDNFKKDILTITTITKDCIEDGVFKNFNTQDPAKILVVVEETDIISDILVALHKNERFRPALPHIANGMTNYVYKVYDEVNGTTTPAHEMVDLDLLNEQDAREEGERISLAVKEIDTFLASIENADFENDIMTTLIEADFGALGRGCNQIRDSYLFGDIFDFLLKAILKSETCAQLGVIDDDFINKAVDPESDLEKMLITRQHLAILVVSLKDGDKAHYNSAIQTILTQITSGEGQSLKSILTYSNLRSMGLSKEKSKTISGLLTSMVISVDGNTYTEEERLIEAVATGKIINAVNSALENKNNITNVFNTNDESQDGISDITADEFIETAIDSNLVTTMIENAITNDEGEIVDDPYHIHDKMSASDLAAIENALVNEYNKEGVKDDPDSVKKLENIAHIIGIDVTELFK